MKRDVCADEVGTNLSLVIYKVSKGNVECILKTKGWRFMKSVPNFLLNWAEAQRLLEEYSGLFERVERINFLAMLIVKIDARVSFQREGQWVEIFP